MPPDMNYGKTGIRPLISVIVCTYNRMNLLRLNLSSLVTQTVDKSKYEVILIDDGSTDGTGQVVDSFAGFLPVRYFHQRHCGLSAAKNHGIFAARGDIVLFFDDDDMAAPDLLAEHLKTHRRHPGENFAVLNKTAWFTGLGVITPLMHYITEVGCFLFNYPSIKHGMLLDYKYFWGGRVSCKRSLLLKNGVFRSEISIHYEDIELGYRLAKIADLRVVYNAQANSYMVRPVTFDEFCRRMVMQGRSAHIFSRMYKCPEIDKYCEVIKKEERWQKTAPLFEAKMKEARELDRLAAIWTGSGRGLDGGFRRRLHKAYEWAFRSCKLKGIMEAHREDMFWKKGADSLP